MTISELLNVLDLTNISSIEIDNVKQPFYIVKNNYMDEVIHKVEITANQKEITNEHVDILLYNDTDLNDVEIVLPPLSNYIHVILNISLERSQHE